VHALYTLAGLDDLREQEHLLPALADPDPLVRRHAVRLAEGFLKDGVPSGLLWAALNERSLDDNLEVRYQLAWTLGLLRHHARVDALLAILARGIADPWVQQAVLNSAGADPALLLERVLDSRPLSTGPDGPPVQFLVKLVRMIGAGNEPGQVKQAVSRLKAWSEPRVVFPLIAALADGLRQAGTSLTAAGFDAAPLLEQARRLAGDGSAAEAERCRAIEFLALSSYGEAAPVLLKLLDRPQPQSVQLAALATLDRFAGEELAAELLRRLPALAPRLRAEAISVLLKRPERATVVMRAIESRALRPSELTSTQQSMLRNHSDAKLKALAVQVLAAPPPSARQDVVKAFAAALTLAGDAARGKAIFIERCASCHRLGGSGHALGPDLVTVGSAGRESLLNSILDPNREVAPQYLAYVIDTRSGDTLAGVVVSDTAASVTLRQAYGVETIIPRQQIRRMRATSQSVMPEGLEENLKVQDLSDLLEFIAAGGAR
jgi:putative heme-binding domain-containing protein